MQKDLAVSKAAKKPAPARAVQAAAVLTTKTTTTTKAKAKTKTKAVTGSTAKASKKAPKPPVPPPPGGQEQVAVSKFVRSRSRAVASQPVPRPTLPSSYGESRLLLLVRDPQTLFAAWDMTASTVDTLKARIGRRAFEVSSLTLRLTRAGSPTRLFHVGKKTRSRYLKVDGGPSFVAEIGFTPPSGRFELIARSMPCFVPLGPSARAASKVSGRRSTLGYREARALGRKGIKALTAEVTGRTRSTRLAASNSLAGLASPAANSASAPTARTVGGASDLYRR